MDCSARSIVECWAARFRDGSTNVSDLLQSGRPVSVATPENIGIIKNFVIEDRCITIDQFEQWFLTLFEPFPPSWYPIKIFPLVFLRIPKY